MINLKEKVMRNIINDSKFIFNFYKQHYNYFKEVVENPYILLNLAFIIRITN